MFKLVALLLGSLLAGQSFAQGVLPPHKPGEVIVKYKSVERDIGSTLRIANQVMSNVELRGYQLKDYQQHMNLGRFKIPEYKTVAIAIKELNETEGVEYAEPNYKVYYSDIKSSTYEPHKSLLKLNVRPPDRGRASSEPAVIIAIIDTGVDFEHEALAPFIWKNYGEVAGNGVDDDRNGYIDDVNGYNFVSNNNNPFDNNYHGTHVAGIVINTLIEAEAESPSIDSMSDSIAIMPLKFLDSNGEGYVSDAIRAISYALTMGARVLNNSWGGAGFSRALSEVIISAYNSNALVMAAAGNEKRNNDQYPVFPASYTHPNLISVAALDGHSSNSLAWFSNFGIQSVDIGAPGVSIRSTVPNNGYAKLSGTSMATPSVAAAAAAIWITNPELNHLQVKQILLSSSQYVETLSNLILIPGRVDALKGVEVASQTTGDPNIPPLVMPPPPAESVGYYDGDADMFADSSNNCAVSPWLLLPGKGSNTLHLDLLIIILPFFLLIIARFRPIRQLVKAIKKIRNN